MIAPSVGGHHDQPFAVFEVDKGAGTRFTGSSSCGGQEQVPASDDPRADESSRVTVDELMEPEVGKLQRSRGGVGARVSSSSSLSAIPFADRGGAQSTRPRPGCLRTAAGRASPGGPGDGASSASDRVALQGGPVNGGSWLRGVDAVRIDRG